MFKIEILFKSGNSKILEVENFETKYVGDELNSVEWKLPRGRILFISLRDIEAIFQVQ